MALSGALMGAGVASADDYAGNTYADASAKAGQRNATPVISTVNGDTVPLNNCLVVSSRRSNTTKSEVLFNLNCNAPLADNGKPGNSAASPAGRDAKKANEDAEYINDHPEVCQKDEASMTYCKSLCTKTGKCSV